jgi:hypothetical protein
MAYVLPSLSPPTLRNLKMRALNETKTTEVLQEDGTWMQCPWDRLEVGDKIRMRDPRGNLIVDQDGSGEPIPYVIVRELPALYINRPTAEASNERLETV